MSAWKQSLLALVVFRVFVSVPVFALKTVPASGIKASGRLAHDATVLRAEDSLPHRVWTRPDVVSTPSPGEANLAEKNSRRGDDKLGFDWFTIIYCSVVLAAVALLCGIMGAMVSSNGKSNEAIIEDLGDTDALDRNLWSLNLVAAVGQAQFANGQNVPPLLVIIISASMCMLQLMAVALMVTSMDPRSDPVTVFPSSPWLHTASGTPVNGMKWIMTFFLTIGQVAEVAQSLRIVGCCWKLDRSKLLVPILVPIAAAAAQYAVSILVVWSGCNIILTFHSCSDIVYSSMSVFFITSFDEMVFECLQFLCEIHGDFDITHVYPKDGALENKKESPTKVFMPQQHRGRGKTIDKSSRDSLDSTGNLGQKDSATSISEGAMDEAIEGEREYSEEEDLIEIEIEEEVHHIHKPVPFWLWSMLKFLGAFPIIFGFFTLGQAFYTDVMPMRRLNNFRHVVAGTKFF